MATPQNPMVIVVLLFLDGRLSLEALADLVRTKLLPHRRFRQHVVEPTRWFAAPRWRDDAPFEIQGHVARLSIDPVEEAALPSIVDARLLAPLAPGASPWKIEIVDLAAGTSALFVRMHHALADGLALVRVLEELGDVAPSASGERSREAPRAAGLRQILRKWWREVETLWRWVTLSNDAKTRLRGPVGGTKKLAWSGAIPLDRIRMTARRQGLHVTDVLLAATAGALGRYLDARDRDPPLNFRALLPVAVPTTESFGNHYASVFVDLPVGEKDPVRRLAQVGRTTSALRKSGQAGIALGWIGVVGALTAAIEHRVVRWMSQKASLVVSSVVGPTGRVRLAGRTVRSVVIWAPPPGAITTSFSFFGYAEELRLGVQTDAAVVERPQDLVTAFMQEIDELVR